MSLYTVTVTYQFLPVVHRLQVLLLPFLGLVLLLQVGLDGLVLCVEVTHVLQNNKCVSHESIGGGKLGATSEPFQVLEE